MCKYIDAEYLVANALLKQLEDGERSSTLNQLEQYKKNVENMLNHCVVSGSFRSIYAAVEAYPRIFRIIDDMIELVEENYESCKRRLETYFSEGLPNDVVTAFRLAKV